MKNSFSHAAPYIAQLKSIEQQINQNQLQEAAQQLNRVAKTAPHDPRLFLLGSRLAEAAGNPEGILKAARKAHQFAPQWPVATMHLAGVLANRDEAEEAMALATQALQQATTQVTQVGQAPQSSNPTELLIQAAAVAQRLNLHPQALQWLRQAEKVSPDDANLRHQIARSLTNTGDYAGAIDIFTELLQQQPDSQALLLDRLRACLNAQQTEQAVRDGEALVALAPDHAVYPFYLDIARGLTPATQPASLVSGLFDGFAARYDLHWVVQLQYKLPRDVAQMIHDWHPDRKADVLDLGCGTGLLGVCLGPIEGVLVGVDLSKGMIEQAGLHNVYDSFHQVNVPDALQATPENLYHVITALDVFNYVGDLAPVVPNAYRILLPNGHFVFSCEAGAEGEADYTLQRTYRYTHQRSYVQRLLEQAGFKDIEMQDRVLRYEADQPVQGFLVTARKPPQVVKKAVARKRVLKSAPPASS
ncbi:MAG: methyltransferase domain-containing protein [Rhodoferax sp.]